MLYSSQSSSFGLRLSSQVCLRSLTALIAYFVTQSEPKILCLVIPKEFFFLIEIKQDSTVMKVWGDMIYSSNGQSFMDFKVEVVKHHAKARTLSERYLPEVLT